MMQQWGLSVDDRNAGSRFRVPGRQHPAALLRYEVEPDASAR